MFLKKELAQYIASHPKSEEMWKRSTDVLAGGVSHNIRNLNLPLIGAFPPFIKEGHGSTVKDIDNITYDDYWGAHYAMITGYSNPTIQEKIEHQLENTWHLGTVLEYQVLMAERLISDNKSLEHIRFCTSGTESAMYATRLARAHTGRKKVAKAKFGWHGAADTLFYDVRVPLTGKETRGILDDKEAGVISININDQTVIEVLNQHKNELAAVIVEPVLGGGGGFPVEPEFLKLLREETERHDIVLIFDEIITGYRFCNSLYQNELGVYPDLTTMGKIIGGGFPIGAIGGRNDIVEQANPTIPDRVWIGGGTFSSYPLSMIAGLEILEILKASTDHYHRINTLGDSLITNLNEFFTEENLAYIATGHKSLVTLHSISQVMESPEPAEIVHYGDKKKEAFTQLALLNRKITGMHGIGALSFAHSEDQIKDLQQVIQTITPEISKEI